MLKPLHEAVQSVADSLRVSGPLWTASLIADRLLPLPVLGLWPDRTVPPEVLAKQVETILRAWRMPDAHAAITVEHMMYADVHGIDSHGCAMLQYYHRGLVAEEWKPTAKIEVVRESETTALVDGGGGLGHVPADTAMQLAIAKSRATGVASVVVRNSGHFGAAGTYASMAARAGLLGLVTSSTRAPAVVPTFGTEAMLGTNPLAFAAPAVRNDPFVLDMATSTASLGALMTAWRKGTAIPAGWAIDVKGQPVTNGRVAAVGRRLTPLGGSREMGSHKGYGLAAATEILSRVLAGPRPGTAAGGTVEHFFLVIDPARFREPGAFENDLDALMDSLRGCRPSDSNRPVLVAGDPEHARAAERRRAGIPLSRVVVEDLRAIARAAGVPLLLEARGT